MKLRPPSSLPPFLLLPLAGELLDAAQQAALAAAWALVVGAGVVLTPAQVSL